MKYSSPSESYCYYTILLAGYNIIRLPPPSDVALILCLTFRISQILDLNYDSGFTLSLYYDPRRHL
jgi:hypothetical protein